MANLAHFLCTIAKFLFLEWILGDQATLNFKIFLKFPHFVAS